MHALKWDIPLIGNLDLGFSANPRFVVDQEEVLVLRPLAGESQVDIGVFIHPVAYKPGKWCKMIVRRRLFVHRALLEGRVGPAAFETHQDGSHLVFRFLLAVLRRDRLLAILDGH